MVKEMVKTSLSSTSNFWQHTQHKNDWLPPSYSSLCTSRAGPRPLVALGESPWPWLKIWVMLKNFDNILPSLEMKKKLDSGQSLLTRHKMQRIKHNQTSSFSHKTQYKLSLKLSPKLQLQHYYKTNYTLTTTSVLKFCSSQPSVVHWLSSSIFDCSFVRPSRYSNIRPNLHFFQYIQA